MFMGEYHHNIDEKGRLIMPSKFRDDLGENFVVTRGIDSCLYVYKESTWQEFTSKINALPFTKKDVRSFQRFLLSGAAVSTLDKQGRLSISSPLLTYANIEKECAIIGVNDHIEIWDKNSFDKFLDDNMNNISDIAENIFEV